MIKRVVNFLNRHRFLLIIIALLIITILFIGINSILFFHHQFNKLTCTKELDEEYCYHENTKIFINPLNSKDIFFEKYADEITQLINEYNLDEFNNYTAYYYYYASKINYEKNNEYKILLDFFKTYIDTYNIEEFYMENNFFFNIFYNYKIN